MKRIVFSLLVLFAGFLPAQSHAADLLETYTAQISARDQYNSYGERLRSAAAIIRQDRANFHRFYKRDERDEGDSFFSSIRNRKLLERWLNNGRISNRARDRIIYSTPVITVRIFGYGRVGEYIHVTVE